MSAPLSTSTVRVRYAETDKMGVVYYANYFVWFEVGRTDLLRERGWSYREMEADGFALPVVEAACEYRQPARYDDELEVHTTGVLLSPVRVRFDYRLVRPADAATLAEGHTVHASLARDGRPRRLPERVRDLFDARRAAALSRGEPRRRRATAPGVGPGANGKTSGPARIRGRGRESTLEAEVRRSRDRRAGVGPRENKE